MLTQKEKLEQKRLEALLKAEQHRQKEHKQKWILSDKNAESFYAKSMIKKRMELGHPEDFDLSYTKKKKKVKVTKYTHVQKENNKTIAVTDYTVKSKG